jgi:hypothetical protein
MSMDLAPAYEHEARNQRDSARRVQARVDRGEGVADGAWVQGLEARPQAAGAEAGRAWIWRSDTATVAT